MPTQHPSTSTCSVQGTLHSDDRTLLIERIIFAAGAATFRALSPQLYILEACGGTDAASQASAGRPAWAKADPSTAPELRYVPAVNLVVRPQRTYVLDCGTTFVIVTPAAGSTAAHDGGSAAAQLLPQTLSLAQSVGAPLMSPAVLDSKPEAAAGSDNMPQLPSGSSSSGAALPSAAPAAATNSTAQHQPASASPSDLGHNGSHALPTADQGGLMAMAMAAVARAACGPFPGADVCCTTQDAAEAYAHFFSRLMPAHRDSMPEQVRTTWHNVVSTI